MKKIKKVKQIQTVIPNNADILNEHSTSTKDVYACDYINNISDYSTTEQRIGTWIDGKPLYKATVYISSLPNRTATNYNHNIANIDEVYGIEGVLKGVYEGNYYFEPIVNMNAGNISATACGISISRTAITIFSQNTDRSSNSAYITIRYTKTTDQGGAN